MPNFRPFIAAILVLLFIPLTAFPWPGEIQVPQTGQTLCYDALSSPIDCAGTSQDGELQFGAAWPAPRFHDNGNGTITDDLTGLIWLKDGLCLGPSRTWADALATISAFNSNPAGFSCSGYSPAAGFNDWRLPNIRELLSLNNSGEISATDWLHSQGFFNIAKNTQTTAYYYWSSTTYRPNYTWAWLYTPDWGRTAFYPKITNRLTWAVRGGPQDTTNPAYPANVPKTGQSSCYNTTGGVITCAGSGQDGEYQRGIAWPNPRFQDNGDGTVTDNLTGLMWAKNTENSGAPAACNPGAAKNWEMLFEYIECLNNNNYRSFGDWRIPNQNEFLSLNDYSRYQTALPAGHPFTGSLGTELNFPSATTYLPCFGEACEATYTPFDGHITVLNKENTFVPIWPVRYGQPRVIQASHNGTCGSTNSTPTYTNGIAGATIGAEVCAYGSDSAPISQTTTSTVTATLPYTVVQSKDLYFNVAISGYLSCGGSCKSEVDFRVTLLDNGNILRQVNKYDVLLNVNQYKPVEIKDTFQFRAEAGHEYVVQLEQNLYAYASGSPSVAWADFLNTSKGFISDVPLPVADAGSDRFIRPAGNPVTLDGSDSYDPGGANLSYAWKQISGPAVVLSSQTVAEPSFTPPSDALYLFELKVNNGTLDSLPDLVKIYVGEAPYHLMLPLILKQ
jgi:Protein of unknown function (DUF1566)/K319L-like, PKD domain